MNSSNTESSSEVMAKRQRQVGETDAGTETEIENETVSSRLPCVVVIRGPAGAGKSTISEALLAKMRAEGLPVAYIEQDHFRNTMLKHHPEAKPISAAMMQQCVHAAAVDYGSHVVLEGILNMNNYADMLDTLMKFPVRVKPFYLDVPLEETKRRHETREKRHIFGSDKLDKWFASAQRSGFSNEIILSADNTVEESIAIIWEQCFFDS